MTTFLPGVSSYPCAGLQFRSFRGERGVCHVFRHFSGEPNNQGNSDCVGISKENGQWSDFRCTDRYGYICEKIGMGSLLFSFFCVLPFLSFFFLFSLLPLSSVFRFSMCLFLSSFSSSFASLRLQFSKGTLLIYSSFENCCLHLFRVKSGFALFRNLAAQRSNF